MTEWLEVQGYRLALDRYYERAGHLWVLVLGPGRVRLGMDPLGVETTGSLAQVALAPPGTAVRRGEPFGSVEAEKFVGPLVAPLSGTVVAGNAAAEADPWLVHRDPFGEGWLAELAPSDLAHDLPLLAHGVGEVTSWFEGAVAGYRLRGVLAE